MLFQYSKKKRDKKKAKKERQRARKKEEKKEKKAKEERDELIRSAISQASAQFAAMQPQPRGYGRGRGGYHRSVGVVKVGGGGIVENSIRVGNVTHEKRNGKWTTIDLCNICDGVRNLFLITLLFPSSLNS